MPARIARGRRGSGGLILALGADPAGGVARLGFTCNGLQRIVATLEPG